MDEYISREDYCEENCGKENREGYKTCKNCGMLNVQTADVQPVNQWISVKDRLPEKEQRVLVFYKAIGEKNRIHNDVIATNWRKSNGDFIPFGDYEITHWMPLPDPPVDGGDY